LDIEDISGNWGGSIVSPTFSVVLLTDEQVEVCEAAEDFYQAPADNPEYELNAYGSMKITATSRTGDYAVYGQSTVNDIYHYYNGVAATITDKTFTLTVDMTKIVKTDLRARWEGYNELVMTDDDIVDLTGRKPYVIALGDYLVDEDNYVFEAWSASVMKMEEGATFPTELIKDAPVVCTAKAINCIVGSMTNWEHTALVDNSFTFTATGEDQFDFTMGNWHYRFSDAVVEALDTEVELKEYFGGAPDCVTFADGVLTADTEYVVTFIPVDNHTAKVKVSAK
jgi:hypothetical protein